MFGGQTQNKPKTPKKLIHLIYTISRRNESHYLSLTFRIPFEMKKNKSSRMFS